MANHCWAHHTSASRNLVPLFSLSANLHDHNLHHQQMTMQSKHLHTKVDDRIKCCLVVSHLLECRQGGQDGEPVCWSAPSYFDLKVPGGGAEFSKVELCFVVPDDSTLSLFTQGSGGTELPRSRGEDPDPIVWC